MQKIFILLFGAAIGWGAAYVYFIGSVKDESSISGLSAYAPSSAAPESQACIPEVPVLAAEKKAVSSKVEVLPPAASRAQLEHLMKAFQRPSDDMYSSDAFKDLSYMVRHDKRAAEEVKNQILSSESYDERMTLIAALANAKNEETLDFATSLIESMDSDTKNLGFELLFSMGDINNSAKLNATLLDAASYETDPEALGSIINLLSNEQLDEQTKAKANDRFLHLISTSENTSLTARAIDGISRLGNQDAIYLTVVDHLIDPDPDIKTAAISAMNALDKNRINQEMIETLKLIANNPNEPSIVKEYATMILNDL